jgi:hypothetical protein
MGRMNRLDYPSNLQVESSLSLMRSRSYEYKVIYGDFTIYSHIVVWYSKESTAEFCW